MRVHTSHHHSELGLAFVVGLLAALATAAAVVRLERHIVFSHGPYGEWDEFLGI